MDLGNIVMDIAKPMDLFMQDIPKVTSETMTGQGLVIIRGVYTCTAVHLYSNFVEHLSIALVLTVPTLREDSTINCRT